MPAREAQTPISQSAAASDSSSRAAYGAPEAPVMPRKTRIARFGSFLALGCLEEGRELPQRLRAERLERRHRGARVHAGRTLEVPDLEVDPELLGPDVREVRGTEVGRAGAEV